MKRNLILGCLTALTLTLIFAGLVRAQAGSHYDLAWEEVTGGGTTSSASANNSYVLDSTIGQANTGTATGGGYTLVGGLWSAMFNVTSFHVFLPVILD
jgi:hypothetical protein